MLPPIQVVVEGDLDAVVAERLLIHAGLEVGPKHVSNGKVKLDQRISGYNNAAQRSPWLILRDLDNDGECAPELSQKLVPTKAEWLIFRIAVRSTEAWLLADEIGFSSFLGISRNVVPETPETLNDPKAEIVRLARRSQKKIATGLIPSVKSGRTIGIEYNLIMREFSGSSRWFR